MPTPQNASVPAAVSWQIKSVLPVPPPPRVRIVFSVAVCGLTQASRVMLAATFKSGALATTY